MVPGVGYGANALNTRTSLDAPHPSPLPLWGEGVALFEAPHPNPLPLWGEGVALFEAPHPNPLPCGERECLTIGPCRSLRSGGSLGRAVPPSVGCWRMS